MKKILKITIALLAITLLFAGVGSAAMVDVDDGSSITKDFDESVFTCEDNECTNECSWWDELEIPDYPWWYW